MRTTPAEILDVWTFGRPPRLPVDLMFGLPREDTRMNYTEYIEKWKVAMKDAYELAR